MIPWPAALTQARYGLGLETVASYCGERSRGRSITPATTAQLGQPLGHDRERCEKAGEKWFNLAETRSANANGNR